MTLDKPRNEPRRTFAEFFAGIGLVRCGLEPGGWECVYANDNDIKKKEQYEKRFGDNHFHLEDVFSTDEIIEKLQAPVTLATASFPCVDLSLAGHWRGIEGSHSSAVFGFLDCIEAISTPPMLLLENVVGLLSSKGGADFVHLTTLLAKAGYWLDAFQLDARYFVPQSRPRIFLVGVHKSQIGGCEFITSTDDFTLGASWETSLQNGSPLRPTRLSQLMIETQLETGWFISGIEEPNSAVEPLSSLIDTDDDQDWWANEQVDKHYRMMSDLHRKRIDEFVHSNRTFVGTIYRRKRHGKTMAEVRFDGIAGCLRTPKGGSARQIVIFVTKGRIRIRWMTPREYSRLQGVGDFPLVGKTNQQLFGFGDAVCVPAISWIDQQVLTPIAKSLAPVIA